MRRISPVASLSRVTLAACLSSAVGLSACGGASAPQGEYQPPDVFDGGTDAGPPPPDATPDVPPPPPMTGPGAFRVVAGPAALLKNGPPCTSEAGAAGDTWCAFTAPSRFSAGAQALYVVNLSAALGGTPITCGGAAGDDLNCLLLTSGFAQDDTHGAFFQGNTLVYFDVTATPYGWRPGMLNGRRLAVVTSSGGDVHDCLPARVGNAVTCLHDIPAPAGAAASSTAVWSELLLGSVAADSPLLAPLATVISSDTADDQQRFQVRIVGPSGDRIAWSSRATPGGPEILNQQMIADPTTRTVVATDVSKWALSADGAHWGWLSAYNYDSHMPSGTLQLASYPAGDGVQTLMEATATYSFTVGSGLALLTVGKELLGIVDPVNAPTKTVLLDDDVINMIAQSKQGHLAYVKSYDFVFGLVDLYARKYDGTGATCSLDRLEEVPYAAGLAPRFLPGSTALLWSRVTNLDTTDPKLVAAGRFTELGTCTTSVIDPDVVTVSSLGDDRVVFSNGYDGTSGTLLTRPVVGGTTLGADAATVIQTRADASLSLYPFLNALAYTVNVGDPSDGLYLYPVAPPM